MIKNYNLFRINESITISNGDVIDIVKSLESEDSRNEKLINKLVNHTDTKGKNVLMSIIQSNDEELIDYILKFDIDINHKTKSGENVLFFCKNVKIFNKFYKLGADPLAVNTELKSTILNHLSIKKIFNVELYQQLINDGVDINHKDLYNRSVISESILNIGIVEFLIKNNVNLNDNKIQSDIIHKLIEAFRYYDKKRSTVLKIFKLLFENGMKVIDIEFFANSIIRIEDSYKGQIDIFTKFLTPLKKYITDSIIIEMFKLENKYYNKVEKYDFNVKLLYFSENSELYNMIKNHYDKDFYDMFADYIKENPFMENIEKYNL